MTTERGFGTTPPIKKYKLKAGIPAFAPVSGTYKGIHFVHSVQYADVPNGYETRFTQVSGQVNKAPDKRPPQKQVRGNPIKRRQKKTRPIDKNKGV